MKRKNDSTRKTIICLIVLFTITFSFFSVSSAELLIDTIAGTGTNGYNDDGIPATEAHLNNPNGAASDNDGFIYISDTWNNKIRMIDTDTIIHTYADLAFGGQDIDVDDNGNIYIANHGGKNITIIYPNGDSSIIGPVSGNTNGVAVDSQGNVFFTADHLVYKYDTNESLSVIAGTGVRGFSGDGDSAILAQVNNPLGIDTDSAGNVYIADNGNCRIRKIDTEGDISTIAGTSACGSYGDNIPAKDATIGHPSGLTIDNEDNIYFADQNNYCIRKIDTYKMISTVAGVGTNGFSGDKGLAINAELSTIAYIKYDEYCKSLLIADWGNKRIRKIYNDTSITAGLVAYYPFNGNASDESGNGNHGSEHGGIAYVGGIVGQAASFDGVDDYIQSLFPISTYTGDPITTSAWVYLSDTRGTTAVVDMHGSYKHSGSIYNQDFIFAFYNGGAGNDTADVLQTNDGVVRLDEWYHVVGVANDRDVKFYINGSSELSHVQHIGNSHTTVTSLITIGMYTETNMYLDGMIDEVRIYNRALTECEIQELYNTNQPPTADAGPYQTVEAKSPAGAVATLDGSDSTDPDSTPGTNDDIEFFEWYENNKLIGASEIFDHTFGIGNHIVTLLVEDTGGLTDEADTEVLVQDTTPPVPKNGSLPNVYGQCSASIDTAPTATDIYAGTITGTTTDPLSYAGQGTYTVNWTYDDGNNNISTQTQTVIVDDNVAPVPDQLELPIVTGQCSASITTVPTATDNCAGSINGTTSDSLSYAEQGTYTVTWAYTDGNGNSSTQSQSVVVQDTIAPELTIPADGIAECTGSGGTPVDIGTASATDNCCGVLQPDNDAPELFPVGTTVVTWTATDCNGNTSTATQSVTVQDTTAPVITAPVNMTVECAGVEGQSADIGTATASDVCCEIVSITNNAPALFAYGETVVTWTAEDCHGLTSTTTQTITVQDFTPPELTVPSDVTIEVTGPDGQVVDLGNAVASDACCNDVTIANDAPELFLLGSTTVTWAATDCHGNATTATQTVRVVDTTVPEVTISATPDELWPPNHKMRDVIVQGSAADVSGEVTLTFQVNDEYGEVEPEISDFDETIQLLASRKGKDKDGRLYTITVTATDISGNEDTATTYVLVPHDQGKKKKKK